jgi:hypothetical protein
VVGDIHSAPGEDNTRADWLANMIIDQKPDVVMNLGDTVDFASLSSYDKGKRSTIGRNYRNDIESHLDFQTRMWEPVKARKKKMPETYFLEGNHEQRVSRALDLSPEYDGAISFDHLRLGDYYDKIVRYEGSTPGSIELDGILFGHFFITGVSGRPIGGERPAHMLLDKIGQSCVAGHIHTFDFAVRASVNGRVRQGLINGTYNDAIPQWAGSIGHLWRPGLSILHNVEDGSFDLEWWSLNRMEQVYG